MLSPTTDFTLSTHRQRSDNKWHDYSKLAPMNRSESDQQAVCVWAERIQLIASDGLLRHYPMATVIGMNGAFASPSGALARTVYEFSKGMRNGRDTFARRPWTQPINLLFHARGSPVRWLMLKEACARTIIAVCWSRKRHELIICLLAETRLLHYPVRIHADTPPPKADWSHSSLS